MRNTEWCFENTTFLIICLVWTLKDYAFVLNYADLLLVLHHHNPQREYKSCLKFLLASLSTNLHWTERSSFTTHLWGNHFMIVVTNKNIEIWYDWSRRILLYVTWVFSFSFWTINVVFLGMLVRRKQLRIMSINDKIE